MDNQSDEQQTARCPVPEAGRSPDTETRRDFVHQLGQGRQSAAGPVDPDSHQGNADHQDDGAGHDRGGGDEVREHRWRRRVSGQ